LAEKKPIPSKFHYTFNLRDVSKVFQGLLQASPYQMRDKDQIAKLWVHETSRIFRDRLINNEDRRWFNESCIELLQGKFSLRSSWVSYEELFEKKPILFSDVLRIENDHPEYEEILDKEKLIKLLKNKQDDYNYEF